MIDFENLTDEEIVTIKNIFTDDRQFEDRFVRFCHDGTVYLDGDFSFEELHALAIGLKAHNKAEAQEKRLYEFAIKG